MLKRVNCGHGVKSSSRGSNENIVRQVESRTDLRLSFSDRSKESISLFHQDERFYLVFFGQVKEIAKTAYLELLKGKTLNRLNYVRCQMNYDDFFDKYYNQFETIGFLDKDSPSLD